MKSFLISLLAASASLAQQAQTPVPKLQSPEVQADGRVTFRYFDPHAQLVTVQLEGVKAPDKMQKDAAGVWTFTSPPLTPDLYGYAFESDGIHRLDPSNTRIKPNLLNLSNEVHVPGSASLPWEDSGIKHGMIHHHFYKSGVVGDNRDFYVYTPPGYDPAAGTTYPVLYLLHGYSDDASGSLFRLVIRIGGFGARGIGGLSRRGHYALIHQNLNFDTAVHLPAISVIVAGSLM